MTLYVISTLNVVYSGLYIWTAHISTTAMYILMSQTLLSWVIYKEYLWNPNESAVQLIDLSDVHLFHGNL